jgi:hypothetical protein
MSISAPQQPHHSLAFEQASNAPVIGLQALKSPSTIGNATHASDCSPQILLSPTVELKTAAQPIYVSAPQQKLASPPIEGAVYEGNVDGFQRLIPEETALQASQFVRASAEKAAIPIINPNTGRAWVGSTSPSPATPSDDQHHEIDDAQTQILVTASASAPIVTVSSGGDAVVGGSSPTKKSSPVNEGGEASPSMMPTSNSAPALLSARDQTPSTSSEAQESVSPRQSANEAVE